MSIRNWLCQSQRLADINNMYAISTAVALVFLLCLLSSCPAKLIENETFIRRPMGIVTTVVPQIPPTIANATATISTTTTQATLPLLAATAPGLSYADIVNRSRPILLAPQIRWDGDADDDEAPEPKYFYTQPQQSQRPNALPDAATPATDGYDSGSRHYIDYRKVYGIRYSPHKIRRSFVLSEQQQQQQQQQTIEPFNNSIDTTTTTAPPDEAFPVLDDEVNDAGAVDHLNASPDISLSVDESLNAAQVEEATVPPAQADQPTAEPPLAENEIDSEMPPPAMDVVPSTVGPVSTAAPPATAVSALNSNIMQPSGPVHSTLQLIKRRVQALLANGLYTGPQDTSGQRFLSLFNVIKFANAPCTTGLAPLQSLDGICYNRQECDEMGGVAVDECANGLGVCCVFQYGCGGVSRQNVSYFKSPSYPEAHLSRLVCTLTLELWPNVRQLLVELIFFELLPPVAGTCVDDQFVVTGQNLNGQVPILCGINTGLHMYVNVESALERKIYLSVLTNTATARAFNIRVSQLQEAVAPDGCLQYHTETAGFVQSFNYADKSEVVDYRRPSYFNNLNYAICIQRTPDFCNIVYANEIGRVEYQFQLVNVDQDGISVIPPHQAGAEIYNCADDFIAVNGIRLCGEKLNDASLTEDFQVNAPVLDSFNGPIILPVRTNEETVGRGFKLYYEQQRCLE